MPGKNPFENGVPEQPSPEEQDENLETFDWDKEESRLNQELERLNDPSVLLEHLLNFPHKHIESEYWDNYLNWVNDHAEVLLGLASLDIPGVSDQVLMLLSDIHTFLEERDVEHQSGEKIDALRKKIIDFFRTHLSLYTTDEKALPYRFGFRVQLLSKILWLCQKSDPDVQSAAHLIAIEALKKGWTKDDRQAGIDLNSSDLEFDIGNITDNLSAEDAEEIALEIAAKAGVDLDLRRERLHRATAEEKRKAHRRHLRDWIATVTELEGHAEGGAQKLQKRFGIVNFHHFPIDALKDQYDFRNRDVPYGIIIVAQFDHNDAFNHFGSVDVLKSFYQQLSSHGVHTRIIEVGSPRALATRMLALDAEYGENNKISFALVRAHGQEKSVGLGATSDQSVTTEALRKLRPENLKRFFISKPNIIFDSCSVGVDGGLASEVANLLGATTQGPSAISYGIERVEVSGTPENLKFSVVLNKEGEMSTYGEES